jgi:flotillin
MGDAEADAMVRKAEAWKEYTTGAYLELLISKLPLMAAQVRIRVCVRGRVHRPRTKPNHGGRQVAEPLSHAREVTFVSTGGDDVGASRLTGEVVRVMGQVPPIIKQLTGIDMAETLQRLQPKPAAAS